MKFLKNDIIAILTWAAVTSTSLYLYYIDVTTSSDKSGGEVVGSIVFKKKVAQRKYSSEAIWEDLNQNSPLYNFDTIRTEEDSEATLNLKDGTKISVNENSMILLEFSESALDIKFSHGSIKANRDDVKDENIKEVNISSDTATISMNKSDINLSQEMGKELNLTVNKGNAVLQKGEKKEVIKENQKVVASKEEIKIYPLTLIQKSPPPQYYFISKTKAHPVTFSWETVDKKNKLHIEISRNNSFSETIINKPVNRDSTNILLGPGIYYWRLKARNHQNNKLEFSGTRRFLIIGEDPVLLITPLNNSNFTYNTKIPLINFKWSSNNALNYNVMIAKDLEFKKIAFTTKLSGQSISTDKLSDGTYFWRVIKTMELSGKTHTTRSQTFRLNISKTKLIDPPKLITPINGKEISKLFIENDPITFTWEKAPEIIKSKILLSTSQDFSKIIHSYESKTNFAQVDTKKINLQTGNYYWKVIGYLPDEKKPISSITKNFKIVESEKLVLLKPGNNKVVQSDLKRSVAFSWKRINLKGKFKIEVSENNKFSKITQSAMVDGFYITIEGLMPGTYFWRVKFFDENNKEILRSTIFKFSMMSNFIKPISFLPTNGQTIDMTENNYLNFSWKKLNQANFYDFELFHVKRGVLHSVFKTRTKNSNYTLTDMNKLDIGKFYYTVQGLQTAGDKGEIIRKSPKNKVYFYITLKQKKEKVELKTPNTLYLEQ